MSLFASSVSELLPHRVDQQNAEEHGTPTASQALCPKAQHGSRFDSKSTQIQVKLRMFVQGTLTQKHCLGVATKTTSDNEWSAAWYFYLLVIELFLLNCHIVKMQTKVCLERSFKLFLLDPVFTGFAAGRLSLELGLLTLLTFFLPLAFINLRWLEAKHGQASTLRTTTQWFWCI